MIRIGIIEDNNDDFSNLITHLNRYFEGVSDFNVVRYFNGGSFLKEYTKQFDFLIFDIELDNSNGMDTVRELRLVDPDVPLFFTTILRKYVLNGYEVTAFNYLLKPINYFSLSLTLNRIMRILKPESNSLFEINSRNGKSYINENDLKCIYISNHTITYHTTLKDYTNYGTLKQIEGKLSSEKFIKINSYCIINLKHISHINNDEITIDTLNFKISRGKKKQILNQILKLRGGSND